MMDNLTLGQCRALGRINPVLSSTAERWLATTYDDFVDILNRDIDRCIALIEQNPSVRQEEGEDRITMDIIEKLLMVGYNAAHDEFVGGHSDIVVRSLDGYIWLGEAKIHSDYDYLMKGFNQLCGRVRIFV